MKEQGTMKDLEKKLDQLTKKVAMLEKILDTLPQTIFVKDESRRYIYGNRSFRKKFNFENELPPELSDAELFPEYDRSQQDESDQRILSGQKSRITYINNLGAPYEELLTEKYPFKENEQVRGIIGIVTDNTKNALIQTENRMARDIISHSDLLLMRISPKDEFPIIYSSEQIERYGFPMIQQKTGLLFLKDLFEENVYEQLIQQFTENAEWGIETFTNEIILKAKNGQKIPMNCTVFIRRNQNKELQYFDILCVDRSASEKERRKLKEYETRWELAITSSGNGVWDYDIVNQTIHISPNWVKKLGYDRAIETSQAENYVNLIHPDDRKSVLKRFQSYLRGERSEYSEEYRILYADGQRVAWVVDKGKITERDENGQPVRFIGMVSDVTESKELELKYRESNERYEALFHDAREPIIIENEQEEIQEINQAACDFFGYTRVELLQMRTRDLQLEAMEESGQDFNLQPRADYSDLIARTLLTKSGAKKEVEISVTPIDRAEGNQFISIIHDLTSRSISEAELKRVHQIYQRGIENIQGVPYILEYETMTYSYISERLYDLIEIKPADFTPDALVSLVRQTELLPGADYQSTQDMGKSFRQGKTEQFNIDMELELPSGKKRWISDNAIPIIDEKSGKVIGSHGILLNIDSRKRAEAQLKKSEATFRGLVSGIPDGITLVENEKVDFINENMCSLTGYSVGELKKLNIFDLAHPDDHTGIMELMQKAKESGSLPDRMEYRLIRKDGEIRYVQNRWGRLDESFDSSARLIITTDISERVKHEQEIRKLQLAIEQIPISIVITDENGIIEYVNPYFCQLTGYSAEEAKGQNPHILNAGKLERSYYRELWDTISAGQDWEGEFINRKKDGTLYWESATICPIRDSRGKISQYMGIKIDITEEKLREEEQRTMQERLRHQKKLESIGVLAGGVAHEINNPLMGIINYAQLIQDRLEEQRMKVFTEGIIREGNRIAKIIRNLLAFARQREQESFQPCSITEIIDAALSLISTMMRHDQISIQLELEEELPPLFCQEQQIEQVLINLLTNARTALNQRYPADNENKIIIIGAIPLEINGLPCVRIIVEDHGTGIPQDIIDKIFDPFFTTRERHEGTGLGLSISYNIIKEHHGKLEVESETGKYSRFFITLPQDPRKISDEK